MPTLSLHRIPSTPGSICPCPFFFSLYVGLIHINGLTLSLNALLANGYCACARVRAVSCLVPVPSYIASYSPRRQTALLGFYFFAFALIPPYIIASALASHLTRRLILLARNEINQISATYQRFFFSFARSFGHSVSLQK